MFFSISSYLMLFILVATMLSSTWPLLMPFPFPTSLEAKKRHTETKRVWVTQPKRQIGFWGLGARFSWVWRFRYKGPGIWEVVLGSGYEVHSLGLKIVGPTSYKTGPCGPPYFYSLTIEQSQKNGECGCWEKCGHSLATVMRLRRPFCHRGMADCHRPHNRCLSKDQPTNHPTIQPK